MMTSPVMMSQVEKWDNEKSDTSHDDVMLNSKRETPLINGDQHDHTSQRELSA